MIVEYISIIFTILIIVLVFKLLYSYESQNSRYQKNRVYIKTNWLKRILYIGLTLCILWFISISLFKNLFGSGYYKFYPLWIGISTLIYWIGYTAVLEKHLYRERKEIRNKLTLSIRPTSLKESSNDTFSKIKNLIINSEMYLNPSLSLKLLSQELDLSEGYISQQINSNSEMNFNDLINDLRVQNAKQILLDKNFDNYTIESIGLESGFNSKSSFYTAFKKFTNQTPVQFKKDVRNL